VPPNSFRSCGALAAGTLATPIGVAELPFDGPVEIEVIAEIDE